MLVNEVVSASSIALAATEDASNKIPFLGLQWFPNEKKQGLDLKWIKTHKGLGISLAPSNFDTLPTLRARGGVDTVKTQMAFFREEMTISETDEIEIDRIKDANDPYLAGALQSIYDDTNNLVEGARIVGERMRMQLLSEAKITFSANGVGYSYNYDLDGSYATNNMAEIKGASRWHNPTTAKPITDLNNARKKLAKKGKIAKYVLMNSNTFQYLLESDQVKNSILAQNATAVVEVTDENVISVIKNRTKLTIVLYDKMYTDEDGTDKYFYPDDRVTLLPEGRLGRTWNGSTPEERTGRQVADTQVSLVENSIAVAFKTVYGPPAHNDTIVSRTVLPSFEEMDSTFIINVKGADE